MGDYGYGAVEQSPVPARVSTRASGGAYLPGEKIPSSNINDTEEAERLLKARTDEVAPPKSKMFFLVVSLLFVASGSMSTIASKWNDTLSAPGKDGTVHEFNHPFFQTWLMFLGEFICMIAFQASVFWKKSKGEPLEVGVDKTLPVTRFIFAIPAACDFTASTTMYIGLTMTQASVYQMLRGATVLFTGIFSKIFLKRQFRPYQWLGMCMVTGGLACVGLASTLFSDGSHNGGSNPVLGDILVICAQLIVSAQMIIEEKILTKYNVPPTLLVGWEGIFGLCYASTALAIFQATHGKPDNVVDALYQLTSDWRVFLSCFLALLSFPILNGTGQIITKNVSATARMVLDTVRNVVVWVFTLAYASYFKEHFKWLQLVGFLLLVSGNGIFKYLIRFPKSCAQCRDPTIDQENDAEQAAKEAEGDQRLNV